MWYCQSDSLKARLGQQRFKRKKDIWMLIFHTFLSRKNLLLFRYIKFDTNHNTDSRVKNIDIISTLIGINDHPDSFSVLLFYYVLKLEDSIISS